MKILQTLIPMMDIPLDMRQIDSPEGSGYYSKSAPATILNSFRIINSTSPYCFYSTLIRKARGQVTVAIVTIHSNHDKSLQQSVEKAFHPSESRISPDFPQHPMLLSAYIRELIPQSSAGSKDVSFLALYSPLHQWKAQRPASCLWQKLSYCIYDRKEQLWKHYFSFYILRS